MKRVLSIILAAVMIVCMVPLAFAADTTKPTGEITCTNDIASKQKVTCILKDNVQISGYHWGTSSRYYDNPLTDLESVYETNMTTVMKTITEPGTYYLTVVDTAGNLSTTTSMTFYRTELRPLQGRVAPSVLITQSGIQIQVPKPTMMGGGFTFWDDGNGQQITSAYTPRRNATLVAHWDLSVDNTPPSATYTVSNMRSAIQKVNFEFEDDKDLAKYYWGTSSSYTSNPSYSIGGNMSKKQVSVNAGNLSGKTTYYLRVEDVAGNVSPQYSMTFYKTTFDAGDEGTVSPSTVLTLKGNSFRVPTPEAYGLEFLGWSDSIPLPVDGEEPLYTPIDGLTYWARWDQLRPATGISLNKTSVTLNSGASITLTATVRPTNTTDRVVWTATPANIVALSPNETSCTVTRIAPGDVVVTAQAGNYNAACTVKTGTIPAVGITLNKNNLALSLNASEMLTATLEPEESNETITWSSNNASAVQLIPSGKNCTVKRIGSGDVTVTAQTSGGQTDTCRVVTAVVPATGLSLNKSSLKLDVDDSSSLTATITPSNSTDAITWTSSNPSVVQVVGSGKSATVTKVAKGNATITAKTTSGKTATCSISDDSSSWSRDDQYSFSNSSYYFNTGTYTIKDEDFTRLTNYIRKIYSGSDAQSVINYVTALKNSSWGGSCYGMASTALLDKRQQIDVKRLSGNVSTLSQVDAPCDNEDVQSIINYYMVSQKIPYLRDASECYSNSNSDWSTGLRRLVDLAKAGDPIFFCYFFAFGGHAILITSYGGVDSQGRHVLKAYDNRYPDHDIDIVIDGSYRTCVVDGDEYCRTVEFTSDMSAFDAIDFDGPNNDGDVNFSQVPRLNRSLSQISVASTGKVTIKNKAGDRLVIEDGQVSGTMSVHSQHMVVRALPDDESGVSNVEFLFEVDASDTFTVSSTASNLDASVINSDGYSAVSANSSQSIVFNHNAKTKQNTVAVNGDVATFTVNLSDHSANTKMVSFSGQVNESNQANIAYTDGMITATGIYEGVHNVTAYTDSGEALSAPVAADTTNVNVEIELGDMTPDAPTAVGAKTTAAGQLTVSWNASYGATQYNVYRYNGSKNAYVYVGTSYSLTYVDSGLTAGTTYYYKVKAVTKNDDGTFVSPFSAAGTGKVIGNPSAPINLTAKASGEGAITISWKAVTGATQYNVYRYNGTKKDYVYIGTSKTTSYKVTGLTKWTTYYFKVIAVIKSDGLTMTSAKSEAVSKKAIGTPAVPTGLAAKASAANAITVSWGAVTGATQYNVYRYNGTKKEYVYLGTSTTTSYKATGLNSGTTYYFKVMAVTKGDGLTFTSALSAAVNAKAIGTPAVPTGLAAKATAANTITVSWTAVSGATQYNVYRYNGTKKAYVYLGTSKTTSYAAKSLTNGTTYYFKVVAVTKTDALTLVSAQSAAVNAKALGTPATPTGVKASSAAANSVTVSWNAVSGATQYNVYRYNGTKKDYVYVGTATSALSYKVTGLTSGTTYYFKVMAVTKGSGLTFTSALSTAVTAKAK